MSDSKSISSCLIIEAITNQQMNIIFPYVTEYSSTLQKETVCKKSQTLISENENKQIDK